MLLLVIVVDVVTYSVEFQILIRAVRQCIQWRMMIGSRNVGEGIIVADDADEVSVPAGETLLS